LADILKGFAGGSFAFLLAWIFPSAALVGLTAVFVLPIWVQLGMPNYTAGWDSTTALLATAFVGVFLGVLSSTGSTPMYRLVEGYVWPDGLQRRGVEHHRGKRNSLKGAYEVAAAAGGLRASLLYEKLARYPARDEEVAPTRLGNAIRVVELYGGDRFGLDSQTWWTELYSVTPAPIRQEVDNARAGVDFFIASLYSTAAFAVLALVTFAVEVARSPTRSWALLILGLVSVVLPWAWYRVAIWGCGYWLATVQAMVNVGRLPLAESLGLVLPETFDRERELWTTATDFVNSPFAPGAAAPLNEFRKRPRWN
jgi:hypothetical protein